MSLDTVLSSMTRTASEVLDAVLTNLRPYQWYSFHAAGACAAIWTLLRWIRTSRQQLRTTRLRGPPSESFLYGVSKRILHAEDSGAVYEAWAQGYGPVYETPLTLGSKKIILCDPKAVAHFFAEETWTYMHIASTREAIAMLFGKGLTWAHGETHKRHNFFCPEEKTLTDFARQRKSLTPGFSIAAIRNLTPIFYDSAYKAKGAWDVLIESSGRDSTIIDVQSWMNHISLDTIGLAGFSHNFGTLEGKHAGVAEVFDMFNASSTALGNVVFLLELVLPVLVRLPTLQTRIIQKLSVAMEEISNVVLARTQKEMEMGVVGGEEERSIIGLLIKGADDESEFHLTKDEVMAQMKLLLLAGYESTAAGMTWTLLELSRNPDVQTKLRNELLEHGADPTYDELTNDLPYLDAVVHETLRIYPPLVDVTRVATKDDIIPLSEPIRTKSGELVDSLTIAKGTLVTVSVESMNRSAAFWGDDAKVFRPSRWLEDAQGNNGIPLKAKEIQGHRHLLTFVDGSRTCLGKNFALAELKAVLTVLVKNFVFELRDGVNSKIEIQKGIIPRPKIAGEVGRKAPLRVRPYVA